MVIVHKPKTLLEGMMWKYLPQEYEQEVFMYCDIDCLIVKPIHSFVDTIPEETIWVHAEGPLRQHDWGAAFSEEELASFPQNALGLSAGKFILCGKGQQQLLFAQIRELYANHKGEAYYTLEQPFFNKAIISTNHGFSINLGILQPPIVSFNGHNYTNESVFLDMAGEPGNADLHLEKMINVLCMRYVGEL